MKSCRLHILVKMPKAIEKLLKMMLVQESYRRQQTCPMLLQRMICEMKLIFNSTQDGRKDLDFSGFMSLNHNWKIRNASCPVKVHSWNSSWHKSRKSGDLSRTFESLNVDETFLSIINDNQTWIHGNDVEIHLGYYKS